MKHQITILHFFIALWLLTITVSIRSESKEPQQDQRLKIMTFADVSNLNQAGAHIGDILTEYNGAAIHSFADLDDNKKKAQAENVTVSLRRGDQTIQVTVPAGPLGATFKEVSKDHPVDSDAKLLKNIGPLGWGLKMNNSFFGALYRLLEFREIKMSYIDLAGLSGYGFRFQFHEPWCPSSADPTLGYNAGSHLLHDLGFEFKTIYLKKKDTPADPDKKYQSKEEMLQSIMGSIRRGWPVLATGLINSPEWGLITGYQKAGQELFCRTYFDRTDHYDLVQQFPDTIIIITGNHATATDLLYPKSLQTALSINSQEKYSEYYSGITGFNKWIQALEVLETTLPAGQNPSAGIIHANWWIYYSLAYARDDALQYLKSNKEKFKIPEANLDLLIEAIQKEVRLLQNGYMYIPSSNSPSPGLTPKKCKKQVQYLREIIKSEKDIQDLLKQVTTLSSP